MVLILKCLRNPLICSYLRVPQAAGQVEIWMIFNFFLYANNFCDAGHVPILRYFKVCSRLERNVGHFGHGHFGLGRFGPDVSARTFRPRKMPKVDVLAKS